MLTEVDGGAEGDRGAVEVTLNVGRDGWRDGLVTAVPMRRLADEEVQNFLGAVLPATPCLHA